jgi:hypothetical protein
VLLSYLVQYGMMVHVCWFERQQNLALSPTFRREVEDLALRTGSRIEMILRSSGEMQQKVMMR